MNKALLFAAIAILAACTGAGTARIEIPSTGRYVLPAGVIEVHAPIRVPADARDLVVEGHPSGTILRAAPDFHGSAVLLVDRSRAVSLRDFEIDGLREILERPMGLPPSDVAFVDFYPSNGIVVRESEGVAIRAVRLKNIVNFAILVARSRTVTIEDVVVTDSGSRNELRRNNTSGGILLEGGTAGFVVRRCSFDRVLGNAVWTHSMYSSPRNSDGLIADNVFRDIARDAIQVGHAFNVRVTGNRGSRIGYPVEAVDVEGGGIPVGIDTAGNVSGSRYSGNHFEEVNGKCIDLDGFHHGEVSGNVCVNRGQPEEYAFGHYGIVMNNTNPDMQSEKIVIDDNTIDGTKFGGIFVIGSGHRITRNRLTNLNTAQCNESAARFGCAHFPGEPDLLQSGIYLGKRAERPALARDNVIEGNTVSGHRMSTRCIGWAPGVSMDENEIRGNVCTDTSEDP